MILAIDPGPEKSAFVMFDGDKILNFGYEQNAYVRSLVFCSGRGNDKLVIEMIASYGMPVGKEVFETCVWIGRFLQAFEHDENSILIYRKDIKIALCGTTQAKDSNIRQALIDRYGATKERAIGKKASPGPLYGVHGDVWSALAVAETYRMRNA